MTNEYRNSVTAYKENTENGTLHPIQSLSLLPADFNGASSAADIHLTPDNRFLYVSNRGHESITIISVDSLSGWMKFLHCTATEKTPRSFDIDPDGKFLYAGGQGSGKLAAYRLDRADGALQRFQTYDVGSFPVWVLVVRMDGCKE
jgi:6-phosphogluconolactonase